MTPAVLKLPLFASAFVAMVAAQGSVQAQDEAGQFFSDRQLTFYVGAAAGGPSDVVGRVIAANIGRHVSGRPQIMVQNMPGAGSLIMMNHIYNRAPRDGSAMGLPLNGVLIEQRLKLSEGSGGAVRFDLSRMSWIGSVSEQTQVLWSWRMSPFQTFEDVRRGSMILGATSPTSDSAFTPKLAESLLGVTFKLISGYKSLQDIFLASERGEIHGNATSLSSIMLGKGDDLKAGRIRILTQFGTARLPELPNVPTGIELAPNEDSRALLEFWAMRFRAAYPVALPPDVPRTRVLALQSAFDAMMKDPDFMQAASRSGVDLSPVSGVEIEKIIAGVNAMSDERVERLRAAILR